jgi:hypothetical protein
MGLEGCFRAAFGMNSNGGQPGRAIGFAKGCPKDGGDPRPAAELAEFPQPRVIRSQPGIGVPEEIQPVAGQGEFREDHQAGTVVVGILDKAHVLVSVGRNTSVQRLVLDDGDRKGASHTFILGMPAWVLFMPWLSGAPCPAQDILPRTIGILRGALPVPAG